MTSSLSDYRYRIEAVFDNPEARQAFHDYLVDSSTAEPLLFYTQVEQYKQLRMDSNRFQKAKEIIQQYVAVNSPNELNLPAKVRNGVISAFEAIENQAANTSEEVPCPKDMFDSVEDLCFLELKEDSFPRFVRSEQFKKLVAKELKKDSAYLNKIGTRKSLITSVNSQSFVGVDDVVCAFATDEQPYLTEEDIQTLLKLREGTSEKIWETVVDKSDHQVYLSRDFGMIGPPGRRSMVKISKSDAIIPFDATEASLLLMDSQFKLDVKDSVTGSTTFLEYLTEFNNQKLDYAQSIILEELKLPLLAKREMLSVQTVLPRKYNQETKQFDEYIFVGKTIANPKYPPPKGTQKLSVVRGEMFFANIIERKANNLSMLTTILAVDAKGFISKSLVAKLVTSKRKDILEVVSSKLRAKQKTTTLGIVPVNSNGMVDAIKYHIAKNKEQFTQGTIFD